MKTKFNDTTYVLFWGGIYSNWFPVEFTIDGITFNCSEQYMMYKKAMLFPGNEKLAEKILASPDPKEQKIFGKHVINWNDEVWNENKYNIVKTGVKEKFLQNQFLLDLLKEDKGSVFVEASPFDRIWGIGYNEKDALNNIDDWGENLLGKLITELSNEIV